MFVINLYNKNFRKIMLQSNYFLDIKKIKREFLFKLKIY